MRTHEETIPNRQHNMIVWSTHLQKHARPRQRHAHVIRPPVNRPAVQSFQTAERAEEAGEKVRRSAWEECRRAIRASV